MKESFISIIIYNDFILLFIKPIMHDGFYSLMEIIEIDALKHSNPACSVVRGHTPQGIA
jgi:hypothetical protein